MKAQKRILLRVCAKFGAFLEMWKNINSESNTMISSGVGRQCFACKEYEYVVTNNTHPIIAQIHNPDLTVDLPYCGDLDPQNSEIVVDCPPTNSQCFTLFEHQA